MDNSVNWFPYALEMQCTAISSQVALGLSLILFINLMLNLRGRKVKLNGHCEK